MRKSKRKALGQHFLVSRTILGKIVDVINPQQNDFIIEIGAGKGALSVLLAKKVAEIIAIEKDKSLIPFLRRREFSNLRILEEDVLKVEFRNLAEKKGVKLVGNLPYSISSPILFKVLAEKKVLSECFFLLQKEVAERICARPRTKKYAPISIIFQNYFSTNLHFIVSPASFSPPPQVESALISLKKRKYPLFSIKNEELFLKFLKGAFQHRRKKLANNLKKLNFSDPHIREALHKCGISENQRPEQVSLSQFVELYEFLSC